MMAKRLPPVHPGEVLAEEFLEPMGISQYRLAKDIAVPPRRINEIVHGTRAVSADTALRLARYFGTSERFWLNLQAQYDLDVDEFIGRMEPSPATGETHEASADTDARVSARVRLSALLDRLTPGSS